MAVELRIDEQAWRAADLARAINQPGAVALIAGPPPWRLAAAPPDAGFGDAFLSGRRAVMHVLVSPAAGDSSERPSLEHLVVTGVRLVAQLY